MAPDGKVFDVNLLHFSYFFIYLYVMSSIRTASLSSMDSKEKYHNYSSGSPFLSVPRLSSAYNIGGLIFSRFFSLPPITPQLSNREILLFYSSLKKGTSKKKKENGVNVTSVFIQLNLDTNRA